MKTKIILAVCSFLLTAHLNAQENTLSETGNVGIGTTSPDAKLEVNGRVKIDSTLVVKDSVTIEKNMKVDGTTKLKDVDVSGYLNVSGTAKFGDGLQFGGLNSLAALGSNEILVIDSLGNVQKSTFASFWATLYEDRDNLCFNGNIPNPVWSNGLNKIFSKCGFVRVGIGTDSPYAFITSARKYSIQSIAN